MSEKVIVTCLCRVEIEDVNEYEALTIVEDMLKREYPLSEKKIFRITQRRSWGRFASQDRGLNQNRFQFFDESLRVFRTYYYLSVF